MVTARIDDDLHKIVKDKLESFDFRMEYKDVTGVINKAVYKLLIEEGIIKKPRKKK